jgi:hypothetical protein
MQSYAEVRPIWTNARDTYHARDGSKHTTAQATIWRWREAFQHDFAARMDWCVMDFDDANHNPIVVVNGETGKDVIEMDAAPGETIQLSADGTEDPDGDRLKYFWWNYQEAGSHANPIPVTRNKRQDVRILIPEDAAGSELHFICEVRDNGDPELFAYRRIIVNVSE